MKHNLKLAQRLFLCLTPLVTGSVFATLPSFAATLATSEATATFSNFSHNPLTTETTNSPSTSEGTNNTSVLVDTKTESFFSPNPSNPSQTKAFSSSASRIQGNGFGYDKTAQSSASLIAYNFQVGAGETFSFDFSALLGLKTSVDNRFETANSFGTVAFQVYDSNNLNTPLDFFTISAGLNSLDNSDFLNVFKTSNVTLYSNPTTIKTGGNQEAANTNFTGRFSRFFEQATSLIFREFKSNSTSAGASCAAP